MKKSPILRTELLGFSLAALAILAGCKKQAPTPTGPPEVEVVTVEQRDVPIYQEFVGTLQAEVNATISAQVGGYLLSRNYMEGSVVTNGQVLFQIDSRTYKAALDEAEAKAHQDGTGRAALHAAGEDRSHQPAGIGRRHSGEYRRRRPPSRRPS